MLRVNFRRLLALGATCCLLPGDTLAADLNWTGNINDNWEVGGPLNWADANGPALFQQGDAVTFAGFGATGAKTNNINLTTTLAPLSIAVINTLTNPYLFIGPGRLSGAAGLNKAGTGRLIIANAGTNDFSGPTVIEAGTLQIGDGGTAGNLGPGPINNNGVLIFNRSDSVTLATPISGTGALAQNGSGVITLTDANTYTGNTLVNAGTLSLGSSGSIANSANLIVAAGATFDGSGILDGFLVGANQTLRGDGAMAGGFGVSGVLSPGVNGIGALTADADVFLFGTALMEINRTNALTSDQLRIGLAATIRISNIVATATSELEQLGRYASNAVNGIYLDNNFWESDGVGQGFGEDRDPAITFDLLAIHRLDQFAIWNSHEPDPAIKRMIVEYSLDGTNFQSLGEFDLAPGTANETPSGIHGLGGVQARYVRFDILENYAGQIFPVVGAPTAWSLVAIDEVEFYGELGSPMLPTIVLGGNLVITNRGPALQAGDCFTLFSAAQYGGAFSDITLPPLGPGLAWDTSTLAQNGTVCVVVPPPQSYMINVQPGYNLIANQLDNGGNTLNEIMPVVLDGTHFFKYDNIVGIYLSAYYVAGAGWQPGNLTLHPGEGAFLYSPDNFVLTFQGTPHVPVLPLPPCSGFRLLSRQTNDLGTFDNIIGAPPVDGEIVFLWNGTSYDQHFFSLGEWSPTTPTASVGQAMWIVLPYGPNCPGDADGLLPPPAIIFQPQSQTVPVGEVVTFFVEASGATSYQWRRNGVNLPGETGASLTVNNVQPGDSGAYSVVVANAGGAIVSRIAALDVQIGDLAFADNFADRILLATATGVGRGTNTNATKEPAEPDHAGNAGGQSVWLAWQAPADGIATFRTAGSDFDTLLAVYRGTNLAALKHTASDDDSGGFYASEVKFNAVAGITYSLAVDGSYGASGRIILSWNLEITTAAIPEIFTQPKSQLVMSEGSFTLSVEAGAGNLPVDYQWFLNDQPVLDATNASLTIGIARPADVGLYRVRVRTPPPVVREIFSQPAFVQMAIVLLGDFSNVIAQDKFLDSTSLGVDLGPLSGGSGDVGAAAAPVGGFTGTQIFNTYGAAKEPGEPNHCGEIGGASYWFAYQSPANGRLSVNTSGSTYDTVLAVYSGPDPVTSFSALSCLACANATGPGGEVVEFDTLGGTIYYVAVDGVGGVTGDVRLSYDMITARPVIANQPRHTAVAAGNNGILTVGIANTPVIPLSYQWQFNSTDLPGATETSYTRPAFQPEHQGNYRVIVTNLLGAVTSSVAMMYLDAPPIHATNSFINGGGFFQSQWLGPTGSLLTVQVSTDLTNWSSLSTGPATSGFINFTDGTPAGLSRRYYRTLLAFP